jgi:hypothetical protein
MAHCYEFASKNISTDDGWISVAVHGGGGPSFPQNHVIFKFIESNYPQVSKHYSVELPNHGKREKSTQWYDAQIVLDHLYNLLKDKIDGKKVVFVGYSVGGIFMIKSWFRFKKIMHKDSFAVFIGTGIRMTVLRKEVEEFWTEKYFLDNKRDKTMAYVHGKDWLMSVDSVHSWLSEDSAIWVNTHQLNQIKNERMYFICGTHPHEAFHIDDILFAYDIKSAASKTFGVYIDHFSYFSTHWYIVEKVMDLIFKQCLPETIKSKL